MPVIELTNGHLIITIGAIVIVFLIFNIWDWVRSLLSKKSGK